MTVYIVHAVVDKVEEKFDYKNHRKDDNGGHAFDSVSRGWFVHFVGSNESIKLADIKPEWEPGTKVRITFIDET